MSNDEKIQMLNVLQSDIYSLTARRRNHIILRLDSFLSDGAATYDSSILTIEHVLPQTVHEGSEWSNLWPDEDVRKAWTHKLANLVPLNKRRNSKAQNYDFDKKKTAYFAGTKAVSSYVLTTQVLNEPQWTPDVILKRQDALLNVFKENWGL